MKSKGFMKRNFKKVITLVMAASLVLSGVPAAAAPATTNTSGITTKASSAKVNVGRADIFLDRDTYTPSII